MGDKSLQERRKEVLECLRMTFYNRNRYQQQIQRKTRTFVCPGCGVLLDASESRCFQCGAPVSPMTLPGARLWWKRTMSLQGHVTFGLVIVNFFIFFLTWILSPAKDGLFMSIDLSVLDRFGAKNTSLILEGQVWRLLTAVFLHGNLMHIFFNMMALLSLGPVVEELYGWERFLFLYIFSGIVGYIGSCWYYPNVLSIGASGSIMGIAGVLLATSVRDWKLYGPVMGRSLVRWLFYVFVLGFILRDHVDNAAHVGGIVAGFLGALPFSTATVRTAFKRSFESVLGWGTLFLIGASFVAMAFMH